MCLILLTYLLVFKVEPDAVDFLVLEDVDLSVDEVLVVVDLFVGVGDGFVEVDLIEELIFEVGRR